MKPGINDSHIEIPVTFDVQSETHTLPQRKITLGIFMIVGICVLAIVIFLINISVLNAIIGAVVLIVGTTLVRLIWFQERYFAKCYQRLLEHDFRYGQDLIWDIYDISDGQPAICRYRNGVNAIFIAFDKDIIVGKGLQNEHDHYEAISDAYQFLLQKGFSFMHIDYMDVVGKDSRFEPVVQDMLKTPNEDLRQLLAATFEYQQFKMNRAYAAYDVYALYYRGDDNAFLSELDTIIAYFMKGNFIRYKILDTTGIRELVKSIYNLPEFSVYRACDKVLVKSSVKKYVRVRKTFKNGTMTVVSKTTNEMAAERYQRERERAMRGNNVQQDEPVINNTGVDTTSGFNQGFIPVQNNTQRQVQNPFAPVQNNVNSQVKNPFAPKPSGVQNPFAPSAQNNNTASDDETIDW